MRTIDPDQLYELLPVLYRLQDHERGRPLQALLRVIAEQASIVDQNIDRLWDDFFIETCQDWVIPYIGDLVANNALRDTGGEAARVDVARTIYYRRRKGTLPMLEELARNVTRWGGRAVEFFELLGWMQKLNHLRFQAGYPDLRDANAMDLIDGPFDQVSHTVDVRVPGAVEGWHNIPNIGFFLYRLTSYPHLLTVLEDAAGSETASRQPARPAPSGPNRFHFSAVRARGPLFTRWRPEGDPTGLAREEHVPGPIRPRALAADLDSAKDPVDPVGPADLLYYGGAQSFAVFAGGVEVPATQVICKDLASWQGPPAGSPLVAVDTTRGRLAFAPDAAPGEVTVHYHHGFSGDLGGGAYDRRRTGPASDYRKWGPDTVADPIGNGERTVLSVSAVDLPSVTGALTLWEAAPKPLVAVIQIDDDRVYPGNLEIDMTGVERLTIQAGNGQCPTILGNITVKGVGPDARLVLDGLTIEGRLRVEDSIERLRLAHCTLVPGGALAEDGLAPSGAGPSVEVAAGVTDLTLTLHRTITGGLSLPEHMGLVDGWECIIDGRDGPAITGIDTGAGAATPVGPKLQLRSATLFGSVRVHSIPLATEVIFTGPALSLRTGEGCVRFSYVPPGSRTPRRHHCQPDLALDVEDLTAADEDRIRARLVPSFTSIHYGDPGYCQLSLNCPDEIRTGAEDGSEMGVFSFLRQPQRVDNLRMRLDEYLPFGLEPALIYVT